jgi:hypothetical protein
MYDIGNWHDVWIVIERNLFWLALAFVLGLWTGYKTSEPFDERG